MRRVGKVDTVKAPRVDYADTFSACWQYLAPVGSPKPDREFAFAPGRKFRADFHWGSPYFVIVEIDGGTMMVKRSRKTGRPVVVGRHNLDADRIKTNLAAELGYRVLHYTPAMLNKDPGACIEQVLRTLAERKAK